MARPETTMTALSADLDSTRIGSDRQRQAALADSLGIAPLTVQERANAMLQKACNGWRRRRRCTEPGGEPLIGDHPACVLAQYQHDALLLDHGLLDTPTCGDGVDERTIAVAERTLAGLVASVDVAADERLLCALVDLLVEQDSTIANDVIERYLDRHGRDRSARRRAAKLLYERSSASFVGRRRLRSRLLELI